MASVIFLCILSALAVAGAEEVEDLYRCPDHVQDYVGRHLIKTYKNRCYEFFDAEKRWVDAKKYCVDKTQNGRLIEIYNAEMMNWVKQVLYSLPWENNGVWNGANDRMDEGTWEWNSGIKLSSNYTYWASRQPNRGIFKRLNDCAVMKRGDGWRWRDVMCNSGLYTYKFICEFEMREATTSPITSITTSDITSITTSSTTSDVTSSTADTTSAFEADADIAAVVEQHHHRVFSLEHMIGLIVGGVLLILLFCVLLAALLYRRRATKKKSSDASTQHDDAPMYYESSSESVTVCVTPSSANPMPIDYSSLPPPYKEKEDPAKLMFSSLDELAQSAAGSSHEAAYEDAESLGLSRDRAEGYTNPVYAAMCSHEQGENSANENAAQRMEKRPRNDKEAAEYEELAAVSSVACGPDDRVQVRRPGSKKSINGVNMDMFNS